MTFYKIGSIAGTLCLLGSAAQAGDVTLTADDVTSAIDIETAIQVATNSGTERGSVTLDGRAGPFVYTGADRSINLSVSNLVLRGIHDAILANCDDGLFFDGGIDASRITIERLAFVCVGNGIREGAPIGLKQRILIVDNDFEAGLNGILLSRLEKSTILHNTVIVENRAIALGEGSDQSALVLNDLQGFRGIDLEGVTRIRAIANTVEAEETGVLVRGVSSRNKIVANTIGVQAFPGISLQPDTFENNVIANRPPGGATGLVIEDLGTDNRVLANR
jgi:hypothetical protein